MIKINKQVVLGIITVFLMSIFMTACTFTESPSNSTQAQNDDQKGGDKSKQTEIVIPDPDAPAEPEKKEVSSGSIAEIGEAVSEIDVQNGELIPDALVYTINKAEQFDDHAQAGISEDEMNPFVEGFVFDEQGKLKPSVKFVVVDMTVENIRAELDRNITSFSLLCADSDEDISDDTTEINFFDVPIPCYFSNPSGSKVGDNWKEYYFYRLPVGQSKDLKVGWYIDTDQYDLSKLYVAFNRYDEEYQKFVKIEFTKS